MRLSAKRKGSSVSVFKVANSIPSYFATNKDSDKLYSFVLDSIGPIFLWITPVIYSIAL